MLVFYVYVVNVMGKIDKIEDILITERQICYVCMYLCVCNNKGKDKR